MARHGGSLGHLQDADHDDIVVVVLQESALAGKANQSAG
jgi:hypothetical protein